MTSVVIETTPMSYRVHVTPAGYVKGTDVSIYRHCQAFNETNWNPRARRFEIKKQYRFYDVKQQKLYLPRYDLPRFLDLLEGAHIHAIIKEVPLSWGKKVEIKIRDWVKPKSKIQADAIEYCVNDDAEMRGLALVPGAGKSSTMDTHIRTPCGWTEMRDIRVGDRVLTPDGAAAKVLALYPQGVREVFKISLADGQTTRCDREHLWPVTLTGDPLDAELMPVYVIDNNLGKKDHYFLVFDEALGEQRAVKVTDIVPDGEEEVQCIEIDHPEHLFIVDDGIITHNTASSLVSAARIGRRTLIKTPILLKQWTASITKFLEVTEDEIYIISGSASVKKLLEEIDKTIFPKFILASLQTLRDYANRKGEYEFYPPIEDFLNLTDVGTVVSDEVHMHFHAVLMTDLVFNPKVYIPMSATFEVTSQDVEPIFNGHFPKAIRFGENQYNRHVMCTCYTYTIPQRMVPKNQFKGAQGYSHNSFEEFFLKNQGLLDRWFDSVAFPIIYAEYVNYALPGEKMLILCYRTDMCEYFVKKLKMAFPDKKVGLYISGSPESVKTDNDYVVSTVKSAGVGFDMPGLISTWITVAADSPPLNKQMFGRLREIDGRAPRLSYTSCLNVGSHVKYQATRYRLFPPIAKSFSTHAL